MQVEQHRAGDGAAVDKHHGWHRRRALAGIPLGLDPMHLDLRIEPVEL